MQRIVTLAIACVAAVAFSATAQAADPPRSWPMEAPPQRPVEYLSGWYVRGDIGYRFNELKSVSTIPAIDAYSYADTFAVGGGFGYKWNWFRADLTLDYGLRGRFDGNAAGVQDYYRAKIDAFSALANVYIDLGTWAGLTPYVGVGAGGTRLNVTDFYTFAPPFPSGAARDHWNFSWAWMAGVSYQFTSSLVLDIGYRHLRLGDAMNGTDPLPSSINFKDLSANEVRIGLRLMID